jgi:hypothetical protein
MITTRLLIICGGLGLFAGCAEESPPPSVAEFLENRILLEATMVRCGENRNMSKYNDECVNAREAINRIAAEDAQARREEREADFERERESLRRIQAAEAETKRIAAEVQRKREAAEYLGVYEDQLSGAEAESAPPPVTVDDSDDVGKSSADDL